jgi:hypothetical protein
MIPLFHADFCNLTKEAVIKYQTQIFLALFGKIKELELEIEKLRR